MSHGARSGAAVAGVWLIAIGLVLLVRDLQHWSWAEAWPLFVIAAGGASLVTSLPGSPPPGRRCMVAAVADVRGSALGAILLASTTGRIDEGPMELVTRWWPVVLVGIGIWFLIASVWPGRQRPVESFSLPLASAQAADVHVSFGAGELSMGRAAPGLLIAGTFEGGVLYRSPAPGIVEVKPDTGSSGWPLSGQAYRWSVGLTGEVPLDLRLDTGASRATVDLGELALRRLDLRSGASETRIRLPMAAGYSQVRTETGVASLSIDVPPGVAARIRSRMTIGRTSVDEGRFPRTLDGWELPDYATAQNRVEVEVGGGVGSVTIR